MERDKKTSGAMTKACWHSLCSSGLKVSFCSWSEWVSLSCCTMTSTELQALMDALRVDPDNRYLGAILAKLSLSTIRRLKS